MRLEREREQGVPSFGAYIVGNEGAGKDPRVSCGLCRQVAVVALAAGGGWKLGLTPVPQRCRGCHRLARFWQAGSATLRPQGGRGAARQPPASLPFPACSTPLQATISINIQIVFLSLEKANKRERTSRAAEVH